MNFCLTFKGHKSHQILDDLAADDEAGDGGHKGVGTGDRAADGALALGARRADAVILAADGIILDGGHGGLLGIDDLQVLDLPLAALGVKMPQPVVKLSGYMGNIVTPLALFYIGYALYEYGFKSLKPDRCMLAVMGMRFIAAPLIMLVLCKLFGLSGMPSGVLVIESAMPVMTQAVVVAAANDADESFVAAGMSLTTLGCFIFVPLLMLLMDAVGLV